MKIVRKKLTPDELSSPNLRYDSGTDTVQQTADGGTTWVNAPSQDPRHATTFVKPPLTGSDVQCRAAANMTKAIHDGIDAVINAVSEIQGVTSLLAVVAVFLPGIDLLYLLIWALVEAFFAIETAVIGAAFTTDVYDGLLCIFYDHIGSDGSVTAAQLSAILDAISSQYGGVVLEVMDYLLNLWGEVGLANAGATGDAPHDCSSCITSGCNDFSVGGYTLTPYNDLPASSLDSGFGNPAPSVLGIYEPSYEGNPVAAAHVTLDLGADRTIGDVTFDLFNNSGSAGQFLQVRLYNASMTLLTTNAAPEGGSIIPLGVWTNKTFGFSQTGVRYIDVFIGANNPTVISGDLWVDNVCWG